MEEPLHLTIQTDVFIILALTALICVLVILLSKKIDRADPLARPQGIVLGALWLVQTLDNQVRNNVGPRIAKNLTPYIVAIAIYIFLSNILGLFSISSPTSNYSVTLTLAIITWTMVQIAQLKAGGFKAYMHAFIEPIPVFLPMNIFGKFSSLLSMSLRLFGNIQCGSIIMSLVYSFTGWCSTALISLIVPTDSAFNFVALILAPALHFYFDLFAGFIQTLIFITLTMVFVGNELPEEMKQA